MSDFVLQWFLRGIMSGFILALPIIGHLYVVGIAALSLWAANSNPTLFHYLWLWDSEVMKVNPETGESEAVIGLSIAIIVGLVIGAYVGDSFKNHLNPLWNRLRGFRFSFRIPKIKVPSFRRKKNG